VFQVHGRCSERSFGARRDRSEKQESHQATTADSVGIRHSETPFELWDPADCMTFSALGLDHDD
jgi:hypothetical protein